MRFIEDCQGPEAERAITTMLPGNIGILENTRFHAGEETNDPELGQGDGGARRLLRRRRFLDRAPRPCLDRRHHAFPAELCRAGDGGRTERARTRARRSRAAGRRGGRRRQGLDQARRARPSGRQGRSSDHRRRHGQYLPRRARRQCRKIAVREGLARRSGEHLRTRRKRRLHHPSAL